MPVDVARIDAFMASDDPMSFLSADTLALLDAYEAKWTSRHALQTATALVLAGFHVLPLNPGDKLPHYDLLPRSGDGPGPDGKAGFYCATDNLTTITDWFTAEPDAGIGIWCKASQVIAYEIEGAAKGGDPLACAEMLLFTFGSLPYTWATITPSGGVHLIYRWNYEFPAATRVPDQREFAQMGLDNIKRDGILVMPTDTVGTCPQGRQFVTALTTPIAPAPAWFVTHSRKVHEAAEARRKAARPPVEWTGPADAAMSARAAADLSNYARHLLTGCRLGDSRHSAVLQFTFHAWALMLGGRIRDEAAAITEARRFADLAFGEGRERPGEFDGIVEHVRSKAASHDIDPI